MEFRSLPDFPSYAAVRELQLSLVECRIRDEIPDTVLFVEHAPVITRGRGLQHTGVARERHAPLVTPVPEGVEYAETERGGDLTYHGPGQLVIYPICKLDGSGFAPSHDVGAYLRGLEQIVMDVIDPLLEGSGLRSRREASATGVWVGDRKVASLGIAVRKWVTYHGVGLNVRTDLAGFRAISPCGFEPEVMANLETLAGPRLTDSLRHPSGWRPLCEARFQAAFLNAKRLKNSLRVSL